MSLIDPVRMIRPKRKIRGYSAILLPFESSGQVDWKGFEDHVARTHHAGLIPAVNMDTGFGNLIDPALKDEVLKRTRSVVGKGEFVAGAFVGDTQGASLNLQAYKAAMDQIHQYQGIPVIFQSYGLTGQSPKAVVESYAQIGEHAPRFIAFELGTQFAPFGKIYDLETYQGLLGVKQCIGAKHSSLNREMEWERILLRDRTRPDFMVFTGNDLAIDMVMYGSDYLLGLSTFAPEAFALRDKYWELGDPRFFELNDLLQYLGFLAFRQPVPAYKHSAAQFLKLRGWIATNHTHPKSPSRPDSDIPILQDILSGLHMLLEAGR